MAMARSDAINAVLRSTIDKNTFVYDGGFFRLAIASSVERRKQRKKTCACMCMCARKDWSLLTA